MGTTFSDETEMFFDQHYLMKDVVNHWNRDRHSKKKETRHWFYLYLVIYTKICPELQKALEIYESLSEIRMHLCCNIFFVIKCFFKASCNVNMSVVGSTLYSLKFLWSPQYLAYDLSESLEIKKNKCWFVSTKYSILDL